MSDGPSEFPRLEQECETCEGDGFLGATTCWDCDGHGAVLTDFGEHVLSFVRRRVKIRAS